MLDKILTLYGIHTAESNIQKFGDGLINRTWKVTTGSAEYILQQVNQSVFKEPLQIDHNITSIKAFLDVKYPEYLFVTPIASKDGETLINTSATYFRLFPFVENSHSLNVVNKEDEAFEAARQFGKFSKLLNDFDVTKLKVTLSNFHNLSLRYQEFLVACENAPADRKQRSSNCISFLKEQEEIVLIYEKILSDHLIPERVIHHDTKINNVLFDQQNKGICVIDLDTVMPGYFISDVGDMMRTYLCAASEEETDLTQIKVRKQFFKAIHDGYMQEMGNVLSETEKSYFIYAGKFMIFMQAIRFLTDYLQNDIYYGQCYEGHNFNRAENQVTLLKSYLEIENELKGMIAVSV
jgi:Ser/Thr protein kinase RdoA (MazF antagonist)